MTTLAFCSELADDRLEPLRRMLLEEIDPVLDTVRIYRLCGRCVPVTEVVGTGVYVDAEESDDVI